MQLISLVILNYFKCDVVFYDYAFDKREQGELYYWRIWFVAQSWSEKKNGLVNLSHPSVTVKLCAICYSHMKL